MILENGVVRTMDASVPVQRALAIAGERVAGGIGTHETALASPDVVDLGGRSVLPGFTDAHVHFPSWALALAGAARGTTSLEEALDRVRNAEPPGGVLRGFGWRDAGVGHPAHEGRARRGHGRRPRGALRSRLPLALAQLRRARARRGRSRGRWWCGRADGGGEPTGILREESAWQFSDRHLAVPDDVYVAAMRQGFASPRRVA